MSQHEQWITENILDMPSYTNNKPWQCIEHFVAELENYDG